MVGCCDGRSNKKDCKGLHSDNNRYEMLKRTGSREQDYIELQRLKKKKKTKHVVSCLYMNYLLSKYSLAA